MFVLQVIRFDSCVGSHSYESEFASYKEALENLEFESRNIIGEADFNIWKVDQDWKRLILTKQV